MEYMTKRRVRELKAEGIELEKVKEKKNEILKDLSDNGYTLHESEILISMLDCELRKMKQRSPEIKISKIIQQDFRGR